MRHVLLHDMLDTMTYVVAFVGGIDLARIDLTGKSMGGRRHLN